jgi:Protein of unknown function (DUF2889)
VIDGLIPVAGPHRPLTETPALAPGQARRTTSIDIARPEGLTGPIEADIRGRDVVVHAGGEQETIERLELRVRIDPTTGRVEAIEDRAPGARTSSVRVDDLVGANVRRRFGLAVAETMPDAASRRSLLYSVLEDLNGASLVSGYAPLRAGLYGGTPAEGEARAAMQVDICAGWARGGAVVEHLRLTGNNAVPMGPVAPAMTEPAGSPSTAVRWHELAPLAEHTVRRLRRLDVHRPGPGDRPGGLTAHFRDSYQGADDEMVMHEYLVSADLVSPTARSGRRSGRDLTIETIDVDVRVLPWDTCPAAAPSPAALDGTPLADLPSRVRAELVGPSTCTHLNSTVRSLADAEALIAALVPAGHLATDPTVPTVPTDDKILTDPRSGSGA